MERQIESLLVNSIFITNRIGNYTCRLWFDTVADQKWAHQSPTPAKSHGHICEYYLLADILSKIDFSWMLDILNFILHVIVMSSFNTSLKLHFSKNCFKILKWGKNSKLKPIHLRCKHKTTEKVEKIIKQLNVIKVPCPCHGDWIVVR